MIKMVQKLFKKISKERKIKEIIFEYFINNLSRLSKQWIPFCICYKVNLLKGFVFKQNYQKKVNCITIGISTRCNNIYLFKFYSLVLTIKMASKSSNI